MNTDRLLKGSLVGVLSVFIALWPAHAGDVKLIKQPASFPLVINQPGSYRLKGNITVPDANTTAISVQADYVTVDLNGYSIQGPVTCSGSPLSCTPTGSGEGVHGDSGHVGITVRNGTVHGMGSLGIGLSWGSSRSTRVESVTAEGNGGSGIAAEMVTNSVASGNGSGGILATTVVNSTANSNGSVGISALTVTGCTATRNGGNGIVAAAGAVTNSTANGNGNFGIAAATATGCSAASNAGASQISASGIIGHNICSGSPCP